MISREDVEHRRRLGKRQLRRWAYPLSEQTERVIGKAGETRKPCSCWMCGNPRRLYGNAKAAKTMQEVKLLPLSVEAEIS